MLWFDRNKTHWGVQWASSSWVFHSTHWSPADPTHSLTWDEPVASLLCVVARAVVPTGENDRLVIKKKQIVSDCCTQTENMVRLDLNCSHEASNSQAIFSISQETPRKSTKNSRVNWKSAGSPRLLWCVHQELLEIAPGRSPLHPNQVVPRDVWTSSHSLQ